MWVATPFGSMRAMPLVSRRALGRGFHIQSRCLPASSEVMGVLMKTVLSYAALLAA
jgi:hypothetical protein